MNSFGIKLNSNGFGGYYAFSSRINHRLRRFLEAEYNFVKDQKETKVVNSQFQSINNRSFIYGKLISTHNLKVGYGYNRMIFEKRDKNSISIHLLGSIGASLAIGKPIYYEYFNISDTTLSYNKFDLDKSSNNDFIIGKAPIKYGLNELKFYPAAYAKFGINFDFSKDVMLSNALEVGVVLDGYFKEIEIMAGNKKRFILSMYVMYHFGKKYDATLNREFRKSQRKNERKLDK
ncbi:hypothetical protein LJC11_01110 [Bacteroidales bacterium OttesenSCG-928-I21]|nr:hypothetical protein [Bacteroidales bacterium OttesenSCG-928-I21]